ncbi:uncharacterized protein METZ01_LOCUS161631, partial [marine metagenome]
RRVPGDHRNRVAVLQHQRHADLRGQPAGCEEPSDRPVGFSIRHGKRLARPV